MNPISTSWKSWKWVPWLFLTFIILSKTLADPDTIPCEYFNERLEKKITTSLVKNKIWFRIHAVKASTKYCLQVPFSSISQSCLTMTAWTAAHQASLSITNSWSLLRLISIESLMPSNHLILCRPLSSCPQSFWASGSFQMSQFFVSVFHIRWPKYWNFSFSISPSNEYSGLISFRMDWLDLLAVQGTLKSLLQKHLKKKKMLAFFKRCRLAELIQSSSGISLTISDRYILM